MVSLYNLVDLSTKKIAVFVANYSFANSASILNLLAFLTKQYKVHLFIKSISLNYLPPYINKNKITILEHRHLQLLARFAEYEAIIAIDPHGFYLYYTTLGIRENCYYYSLELYLSKDHEGLDYPLYIAECERNNINTIKGLIIQSREKEKLFREDYRLSERVPAFILPVTGCGKAIPSKSDFLHKQYAISPDKKIALHLGGIAAWFSCAEIALEFSKMKDWVLFFQGHPDYTYLARLKRQLADLHVENVIFSEKRYDNIEDLDPILRSADIGIAWYNDISEGFRVAGKSSGKITSYLKYGLPIVAKKYNSTVEAIEETGCGRCVQDISEIKTAVGEISSRHDFYAANCLREYNKVYNFDLYEQSLSGFLDHNTPAVNQNYWDDSYKRVELVRADAYDPVRQFIQSAVPRGQGTCLEIGCYPGRYLSVFGELGYTVSGIDLTPNVVSVLPEWLLAQGFSTGSFRQSDFFEIDFTEKYDIVCSFGFLEHFCDYQTVIINHARLVKEGGLLVLTCPNFRGWIQRLLHILVDQKNMKRHHIPAMNPYDWGALVKENGFEIIRCDYFGLFDFWVDIQERNRLQTEIVRFIEANKKRIARGVTANTAAFSPYCGLVARRIVSGEGSQKT
jgi:2-polyprenyl-3-methyl-5-hydroxy-6-metoxy-1,4-benzoquinol methylase/glycosyltransferase involved in cell wall biosynthesis